MKNRPFLIWFARLCINIFFIEHREHCRVSVSCGNDPSGHVLVAVIKPDACCPAVRGQYPAYPAVIKQFPAELPVPFTEGFRHRLRSANGIAGVLLMQVGKGKEHEKQSPPGWSCISKIRVL